MLSDVIMFYLTPEVYDNSINRYRVLKGAGGRRGWDEGTSKHPFQSQELQKSSLNSTVVNGGSQITNYGLILNTVTDRGKRFFVELRITDLT